MCGQQFAPDPGTHASPSGARKTLPGCYFDRPARPKLSFEMIASNLADVPLLPPRSAQVDPLSVRQMRTQRHRNHKVLQRAPTTNEHDKKLFQGRMARAVLFDPKKAPAPTEKIRTSINE